MTVSPLVNLFCTYHFLPSGTRIKEVTVMQNFGFLRENGMFERAQSLCMMKSLIIKIFCFYKKNFVCAPLRLTEMAPDTPAKRRGKL